MEFIFGDQITVDQWLGNKTLPRTEDNNWLVDILGEDYTGSEIILDSFQKADSVINNPKYKKIMCSVSAGRDSCIMMDILYKVDRDKKVDYIWFDTGLEFACMKEHLKYLEDRYDVEIKRFKAVKPIPITCREIGQPFISKRVSNEIARLQRHNFDWTDDTYENHIKKYPHCQQAFQWFDNQYEGGVHSSFNIMRNAWLREFLIENPPWFKISEKCCDYSKKATSHRAYKQGGYDLSVYGVRKLEGGLRSTAYQNCFSESYTGATEYRPLYWYANDDIAEYEQRFNIKQSVLYGDPWNLKRSGCACCPFGRDFEHELELTKLYEPNLYKGVNNIFGDSYKYTRMYREFQKTHKN
jgi:3'-phosphoadenosine 5'-phosphosulfate sulfotransferase (PAPS reductase)/FAD synthetase